MEKPNEDEIRRLLGEYYSKYSICIRDLYSLSSFEIEMKKFKNKSKIRSFLPEIRIAHKLWKAGLKEIEFIEEGNGEKPEFRVRIDNEWIYFEVKSFLFREDIWEEFEKLKNELEKIESSYQVRISIMNIHEFKQNQIQETIDGIRKRFYDILNGKLCVPYNCIGGLFNCYLDILEKGPYEKEKYTKVDLPFPHGSEDISLLTCEIFCRLKEAFMQLNGHAPKNSKVIVLYSYRYYFGVPLPDHFNPLKLSTNIFFQDKNNASVSLVIFLSIIDDFNKTFPNPNRNRDFNISSIENAFK